MQAMRMADAYRTGLMFSIPRTPECSRIRTVSTRNDTYSAAECREHVPIRRGGMLSRSAAACDEFDDGLSAVIGIRLKQKVRTFDTQQARSPRVRDVLVG